MIREKLNQKRPREGSGIGQDRDRAEAKAGIGPRLRDIFGRGRGVYLAGVEGGIGHREGSDRGRGRDRAAEGYTVCDKLTTHQCSATHKIS